MGTWDSLHKQHVDVFIKINLLEKALLGLLQNLKTGDMKGAASLQEDFLKAFEQGMILHFTVEEEALFPVLARAGEKPRILISELLAEHKSIMEKHNMIVQTAAVDKDKILLELIRELADHAKKEEQSIPSIISQLTSEQLSNIDQDAKRLGYRL